MIAAVKQVFARHRNLVEGGRIETRVPLAVMPGLKFGEECRPVELGFADEDHVPVCLRLIRHQRNVRSAQCNRSSALPEPGCQVIGVGGARRVEGDRDQIRRRAEIDRLNRFIDVEHRPMGRHKGGKIRHGDLLEVQDARAAHPLYRRGRRRDQEEGARAFRAFAPV